MKRPFLILSFLSLISIISFNAGIRGKKEDSKIVIAFGSCSHQDKEQKMWDDVISEKPALWIWLGDNIYGDTENMDTLRAKYKKQKSDTLYRQLTKVCPIIGTWDDHDYGANDAGKNYRMKAKSQQEMLDFLDVDANDPRRKRPGVYSSYMLKDASLKIKVLLLDTRYFRDDLVKEQGKYIPQQKGEILGEDQWKWLEEELEKSDADVHLIVSSIQVIPEEHHFEKWANFPNERKRLLDLITRPEIKNPIIISGDRHIGEISKIEWNNKTIVEITSSSLTHRWKTKQPEINKYRHGQIVYLENYAVLEISGSKPILISSKIKSDGGNIESSITIE